MDAQVKTEMIQPVFTEIPDAPPEPEPAEETAENENDAAQPATGAAGSGSPGTNEVPLSEWTGQADAVGKKESTESESSGDSSDATHISAGIPSQSHISPFPTPAASLQNGPSETTEHSPSKPPQPLLPSSAPLLSMTPETPSSSQMSQPLPSSQPIRFDATQRSPSAAIPPAPYPHAPKTPVPKPTRGEDPLPPHLRAVMEEYYDAHGRVVLPPCALVSDNKQSIYIFPGGKKAKYLNREGQEVRLRRAQLPETGYWVSIVEGPTQPAVLVKRFPKQGETNPYGGGTSLSIWKGLAGFDEQPSFFKVAADGEPSSSPADGAPRPAKKPRLSEPSPAPGGPYHPGPPRPPSSNDWPHRFQDSNIAPRTSQPIPAPSRQQPNPPPPPPPPPPYGSPFSPTESTQRTWSGNFPQYPHRFPQHSQRGPAHHYSPNFAPLPHPKPSSYSQPAPVRDGSPAGTVSGSPVTNGSRRPSEVPEAPGILAPDQKDRTQVSFVGGARPRTRPFALCDTVDKLFVQAAAAGFKNFSLSAATFVMIKVVRKGIPRDDPSAQDIAVVKGDEVDFRQLQEVIRDTGRWAIPSEGVDCEVTIVD